MHATGMCFYVVVVLITILSLDYCQLLAILNKKCSGDYGRVKARAKGNHFSRLLLNKLGVRERYFCVTKN